MPCLRCGSKKTAAYGRLPPLTPSHSNAGGHTMSHPLISPGREVPGGTRFNPMKILSRLSCFLACYDDIPNSALCISTLLERIHGTARKAYPPLLCLLPGLEHDFEIRMQTGDQSARLLASAIALYHPSSRDQSPTSATPFSDLANITRLCRHHCTSSLLRRQVPIRT